MKNFKTFHLLFISVFLLTKCNFWNFYPDPDDKGLSRFTSRGYNIATSYVNGRSFVNTGSYSPLLYKDSTGSSIDTLRLTWGLYPNDSVRTVSAYRNISFLMPVSQSFNKTNLLAFNGQRFLNSVPLTIQDTSLNTMTGIATLYFVSVSEVVFSDSNDKYIKLSGLFDGNIGDSVIITKGRFDFELSEKTLNF
jgi:hypothetical protein